MPTHVTLSPRFRRTLTTTPSTGYGQIAHSRAQSVRSAPAVLPSAPLHPLRRVLRRVAESVLKFRSAKPSSPCTPPLSSTPLPQSTSTRGGGDGLVTVLVEQKVYQLDREWLEGECEYFKFAVSPDGLGKTKHGASDPVYSTPPGVTAEDFDLLLSALKDEDRYKDAPQDVVETLLRVASAFLSKKVITLAKARLCALWDDRYPPSPESYRVIKTAPEISGFYPDPGTHTYTEALTAIQLANEHNVPGVLKRAFYELMSSAEFWVALKAGPEAAIGLSEETLLKLERERDALAREWNRVVFRPPRYKALTMTSKCHPLSYGSLWRGCKQKRSGRRKEAWEVMMTQSEEAEAGQYDPLRYDVFARMADELKEQWCTCCIREWETVLAEKREKWWQNLKV
ncbi:hypothetical protein FKP32DRAFT_7804 [Trametes sanguinea]|nr:hypothetical protein FKP32DRAFT_7804 [Trametes sanguinea]